jgi:hypothetical protein
MSDHQDHLDQQSASGLLPMAPPSAGMPRLRGRIHLQDDDMPVDEKQQQDQLWDVLEAKQYRSILIATLAVGAVAAATAAALVSAWPVLRDWIV